MELAQEFHMQADTKDICAVIQESDYSTCHHFFFFKNGRRNGCNHGNVPSKNTDLKQNPKPRNIKETKGPRLSTENSTLP